MSAGEHGVSYKDLLYVRRRFITKEHMREAIRQVVNAIPSRSSAAHLGRSYDGLCL